MAEVGQVFRIAGEWSSEPKWASRAINQSTPFIVTSVTHTLGRDSVELLDPVDGNALIVPPCLMSKLRRVS